MLGSTHPSLVKGTIPTMMPQHLLRLMTPNEELGRHETGVPDIMNRHNPSLKSYTDINDKKYTIVTEIQQIHQHEAPDRPAPEPPDRS